MAHQALDRGHQLLGALVLKFGRSADHTVGRMILEQSQGHLVQGRLDCRDLGYHVDAVAVALDHRLDSPHLTLDPAQPLEEGIAVGRVAMRSGSNPGAGIGTGVCAYTSSGLCAGIGTGLCAGISSVGGFC